MRRAALFLIVIVVSSVAPAAIGGVCAGKACCAKTAEGAAVKAPSCCNATNCSPRSAQPADSVRNGAADHTRPLSFSLSVPAAFHVMAPLNVVNAATYPKDVDGSPAERIVALSTLRI